jgi:uncharacterized protein
MPHQEQTTSTAIAKTSRPSGWILWLRRRLLILAVLELVLFCFSGWLASQFILFPSTHPQRIGQAECRLIPYSGVQLEVVIARSPGCGERPPEAIVVSFLGNAARAEWTAESDAMRWGKLPVEVWAVNHPGFGRSTGPARLARLGPAALAAYDAAAAANPGKPIILEGTSLGCTMALHAAAERKPAGLFLRTPPPLRQLILQHHGWWNAWLLALPVATGVPAELSTMRAAPRVQVPAVFLLIDNDNVIPFAYQQSVVDAFAGPHQTVILHADDHNAPVDQVRRQCREAQDWLWSRMPRPATHGTGGTGMNHP